MVGTWTTCLHYQMSTSQPSLTYVTSSIRRRIWMQMLSQTTPPSASVLHRLRIKKSSLVWTRKRRKKKRPKSPCSRSVLACRLAKQLSAYTHHLTQQRLCHLSKCIFSAVGCSYAQRHFVSVFFSSFSCICGPLLVVLLFLLSQTLANLFRAQSRRFTDST